MQTTEAIDAVRLQEQQQKIDRIATELVRLLRLSVTEQRYGEVIINVSLKGGILDSVRFDPAYRLKF